MPAISFKPQITLALLTLWSIVPAIAGIGANQSADRESPQSTPAPTYLPPTASGANLLCVILAGLGEPSLLDAAKDPSVVSYRVSFFSPVPVHETAVRLVVNADGTGEITSAISSGNQMGIKRTKNGVSAANVRRLLLLIENAEFWPAVGSDFRPKTDNANQNVIVIDGSWWMLEGVRHGSFHYEYRRNPKPSSLTEIGCYMAKDLVRPNGVEIPMAGCASPDPSSQTVPR